MADDLGSEERVELLSRRIREDVTRSVEDQLRRRYSWIGIVTAFVLGGLGYGIITAVVRDAADGVVAARLVTDRAQQELLRVEDSLLGVKQAGAEARRTMGEEAAAFRADIEGELGGLRSRIGEVDALLDARRQDLANLGTLAAELQDLGRQVATLGERLDVLAGQVDAAPGMILPAPDAGMETDDEPAAAPDYSAPIRADIARQYAVIEEVKRQVEAARITVFVHYGRDLGVRVADTVAGDLRMVGYVVRGTELVAGVPVGHEVRFYHAEDAAGAAQVAADVSETLAGLGMPAAVSVRDFTDWPRTRPRTGTVELWLSG